MLGADRLQLTPQPLPLPLSNPAWPVLGSSVAAAPSPPRGSGQPPGVIHPTASPTDPGSSAFQPVHLSPSPGPPLVPAPAHPPAHGGVSLLSHRAGCWSLPACWGDCDVQVGSVPPHSLDHREPGSPMGHSPFPHQPLPSHSGPPSWAVGDRASARCGRPTSVSGQARLPTLPLSSPQGPSWPFRAHCLPSQAPPSSASPFCRQAC